MTSSSSFFSFLRVLLFAISGLVGGITCTRPVFAASTDPINIAYIKQPAADVSGVPTYLQRPKQQGVQGAQLAIKDANITGRFANFALSLTAFEWQAQSRDNLATQIQTVPVIMVESDTDDYQSIIEFVTQTNPSALIVNVANQTTDLRQSQCALPVVHTIASHQMKADALAQWFRTKRIEDILVIYGQTLQDAQFVNAFKQTAKKFKLDIVDEKQWQFSFDLRRAAFQEIPLFTRAKGKYEAVFVADSVNQFGFSLPYNTFLQVPVTGDAGLKSLGWHHTHEQWGARQIQQRFKDDYGRPMNEVDYAAYVAVVALSTALQQGAAHDGPSLFNALLSEQLDIAAYKGRKLSIRPDTHQLRQPIVLANESALVTHAPLPGFLHKTNELDTLGLTDIRCEGKIQ